MIYTSYYGNWRNFPEGLKLASVSFHNPDKYHLSKKLKKLFPDFQLTIAYKNGDMTFEEYASMYRKKLESTDIDFALAKEKLQNVILLCYCKDYYRCHRSILAQYFKENGLETEELPSGKTASKHLPNNQDV